MAVAAVMAAVVSTAASADRVNRIIVVFTKTAVYPFYCGSGLARDGIAVIHLIDRSVCIAGKPAPTKMRLRINL